MRQHALRRRLFLPIATLFCVGGCLSTEGYYRFQDAGASGSAGATGTAGNGDGAGTGGGGAGTSGNAGTGGGAGSIATGRGGTTGIAGTTGAAGTTTGGRGGTTGNAGTTGTAGRGGTTGTAGTTGGGGSGSVLFMDDFEAGLTSKWDFGTGAPPATTMDGTKVLNLTEAAGDQRLGAAGMPNWTNYSVEAKVKVLSFSGTSSSDGVAICARLTGLESFYYLLISPSDTKALKIKINNSGNSSLSSSLDSTGFALNTWVTLRLDVQGTTLTAYLNGAIKGTYTATGADILPMGGIGLMVQRANVEFDDVTVRALP
jgi:hypothetical protein